ncbi:MAG TPA: glycosyltransferase, partial [Bryobacterales bacterium]|nr:glycosyltransferase [Bryobacterales bacterium]
RLRVIEMAAARSVPQLRAEGLRAARGRLVAITEDHCLFAPGWVAGLLRTHSEREAAAVGGPVENGRAAGALDWAIYFSRYAGSMPPLGRGPASALPGNNACYKREILDANVALYAHGFWENEFNRDLVARGYVLWLEPDLVVTHNKPYRFVPYLALRYRHARCFGGMIAGGLRVSQRLQRAVFSPLIPVLLLVRAARSVFRKKRRRGLFLRALPALLLCYGVWFWGELAGYLCGPGDACSQTD